VISSGEREAISAQGAVIVLSIADGLATPPGDPMTLGNMRRLGGNPPTGSSGRGLRKLSPDLIGKARDETATQVTRVGLTFVGTAAFCLLSLLSPDNALLGGNQTISVPLAGPVSFFGFMLLGPAVLIVLRVYLQFYVQHSDRLDRLARLVSVVRAPTFVPLHDPLIRLFGGFTFYMLLPVTMLLFAWKAAAFPAWGSRLFGLAVAVIASHVMLLFGKFSWRSKGVLSLSAAIIAGIIAGGVVLHFELLHRPFNLFRANLSGQHLVREDLRKADLSQAKLTDANLGFADLTGATLGTADLTGATLAGAILTGAYLGGAHLTGANLGFAHLTGANLTLANLTGANLDFANLTGANLGTANLTGANLSTANLTNVKNLNQTQLDEACGNLKTKLPEGLTLKPCPEDGK
jgi:hypothetical protein